MDLWDSHCHLFEEYYSSVDEVIQESKGSGVTHFIVNGVDTKSNREVLSLIEKSPSVYGVIGIHPEMVGKYVESDFEFMKEHLMHSKILGIGEIGLDYHYTDTNKEEQKRLFEAQLRIASENDLPVVIHSRDATQDTIDILKKYQVRGVIHSFSGSLEVARTFISMGFKLGINGVITFKNCKLKEILTEIFPHIILETDSPYLTPHPYRGTQNSPKYIYNIAEFIAKELNISICQVEKVTNNNIYAIFDKLKES